MAIRAVDAVAEQLDVVVFARGGRAAPPPFLDGPGSGDVAHGAVDALAVYGRDAPAVLYDFHGHGRSEDAYRHHPPPSRWRRARGWRGRRVEVGDGVTLGEVTVDGHGHADAAVAEHGDETGDGGGELLRRYGGRSEERELRAARAGAGRGRSGRGGWRCRIRGGGPARRSTSGRSAAAWPPPPSQARGAPAAAARGTTAPRPPGR